MFVQKCDLCKTETEDIVAVRLQNFGAKIDLCKICSEPILVFLRKNKIIDKNNNLICENEVGV